MAHRRSGARGVSGEDLTTQPGQYPAALFGVPLQQPASANPKVQDEPYPDAEAFTGTPLPHAGGKWQPPGTQGREAADQASGSPTESTNVGAAQFGDLLTDFDGPRSSDLYPPEDQTLAVRAPRSTGAGEGKVAGAPHPNAR